MQESPVRGEVKAVRGAPEAGMGTTPAGPEASGIDGAAGAPSSR